MPLNQITKPNYMFFLDASRGLKDNELEYQVISREFDSHWVPQACSS